MNVSELAFVQGMDDTRAALRRWNAAPLAVLRPWALGALAISAALLVAVWVIAHIAAPDPTGYLIAGLNAPATLGAIGHVLFRNSLVLALHAMACVAGFIAGSSLPMQAERHSGWWRTVHEKAGPAAIAFVAGATTFSLCTQAYVLGSGAATLAAQLDVEPQRADADAAAARACPSSSRSSCRSPPGCVASRREAWDELLAATLVTTAVAAPVLVAGRDHRGLRLARLLRLASRSADGRNAPGRRRYWSLHFV